MGIEFNVRELDCPPFLHGFGPDCSNPQQVIAIWDLPLIDINDVKVRIPFYITYGNGPLLLGNNILSKSNVLGEKNLLVIPPHVLNDTQSRVYLPIYAHGPKGSLRTFLNVVPSQISNFASFLSLSSNVYSKMPSGGAEEHFSPSNSYRSQKRAKWFASKLHAYSHFRPKDMIEICRRAKILTPMLCKELQEAFEKCASCLQTGRPLHSRKVSFSRVLASFNDHVQIDFFFIQELGNLPILCMVDVSTGFASTVLMSSRDLDQTARFVEVYWFNVHGPPQIISGDPEMYKGPFKELLSRHYCEFAARPARRHNKIGSVEVSHRSIRVFVQRLLLDAEYTRNTLGVSFSDFEILSRATFLKNALYGSKKLSSFELARGYSPSICGTPQAPVGKKIAEAYREQVARRAIHKLLASPTSNPVPKELLPSKTPVYFFVKGTNKGKWELGFVKRAYDHFVELCRNSKMRGHVLQVAYEDIRLAPKSSLLFELDRLELDSFLPLAHTSGRSSADDAEVTQTESAQDLIKEKNSEVLVPHPDIGTSKEVSALEECSLWTVHPLAPSLYSNKSMTFQTIQKPSMDVGTPCSVLGNTEKDIGSHSSGPADFNYKLEADEQDILRKIRDVVGYEPVSEARLKFAPSWLIQKAIDVELNNYKGKGAYTTVHKRGVPRDANIISSHHFFQIKTDGCPEKLKLKCRLVPHGNRDAEKESLRTDSSTAQFPVIRLVLSLATILRFAVSTIDITGAYLQAGEIKREIYMRPPRGWITSSKELWKLEKPAYGLVDSGRIWQLCVEDWLLSYGLRQLPGLPQFFYIKKKMGKWSCSLSKLFMITFWQEVVRK